MKMYKSLAAMALTFGILIAGPTRAADVTWDLTNVVFADGATASGSFVFNATSDTFISWDITTTATPSTTLGGNPLNGATYTTNNVTQASTSYYLNPYATSFETTNTANSLALTFQHALTNAGGVINLSGSEYEDYGFESRSISSGEVVAAVPLPASFSLFATGMVCLFVFGTRKRAKIA